MFVEHHAIEPQLVTVNLFVEILVEQLRNLLGVKKSIGHAEEAAPLEHFIFRHGVIRPLSEKHYVHMVASSTGLQSPLSSVRSRHAPGGCRDSPRNRKNFRLFSVSEALKTYDPAKFAVHGRPSFARFRFHSARGQAPSLVAAAWKFVLELHRPRPHQRRLEF